MVVLILSECGPCDPLQSAGLIMNGKQIKTAVIGVGNILYGDDGVGVRAAWELQKAPLPSGVEVIDGGSMGVELLEYLKDYERVIVIDAADMGLPAGTVKVFTPWEVMNLKPGKTLSLHSTDALGVIELGETLGEKLAEVTIVAVQPEFVGPREGLSETASGGMRSAAQVALRIAYSLTQ